NDGVHGIELWQSDGTAAGTRLVRDISQSRAGDSLPSDFGAVGERLWFTADDGANGREPWLSDGTAAGTRQVADLVAGSSASSPASFVEFQEQTFFVATTTSFNRGLFRSDGTAAGTVLVRDFPMPFAVHGGPIGLTPIGDRLFFSSFDSANGQEPWISD